MNTFECTSAEFQIPVLRNDYETEFEVQAFLYIKLLDAGLDVRGEVPWKNPNSRRHQCRFDIVIYKDGKPFHAIEVKAFPVKHRNGAENTRQGVRYRKFGVPVTFVYGRNDSNQFIERAKEWVR